MKISLCVLSSLSLLSLATPSLYAQQGAYELFGATCKGTGTGPGAACLSANATGPLNTGISLAIGRNFAVGVNTGSSPRVVTGFELQGNSKNNMSQFVPTWLYDADAQGRPGQILRRGTMNMDTTQGWYSTSFQPILLQPNTKFFLVFNTLQGIQPSIVSSGPQGEHFWAGPPNWSGPWQTQRWSYKVNCVRATQPGAYPLLTATTPPAVGKPFTSELHYANGPGVALHGLGVSDTQWGALQLPFDMTPLGAQGCMLNISLDLLTVHPVDTSGSAKFQLPIPNQSTLLGVTFFEQFLRLDAQANNLGIVLTNGAKATIGT